MLIDAHAHLDKYVDDLDTTLDEIESHQILTISNSMDIESYERNLEIAAMCEWIIPAFGIHPWNAQDHARSLGDLDEHLERAPIVGEVGLDFHFVQDESRYVAQRIVFAYCLDHAASAGKPISIHSKGAEREVLGFLRDRPADRAILHWYSGPVDLLPSFIALDCYFSIGVEVLYSGRIEAIARAVPANRLLTETDNPGGHAWLAGSRGRPHQIEQVVEAVARVRGRAPGEVREIVRSNFLELTDGVGALRSCRSLLARPS